MKYWKIIADNLSEVDWSWGCIASMDLEGRNIFVIDAQRNGKRFIVRAIINANHGIM